MRFWVDAALSEVSWDGPLLKVFALQAAIGSWVEFQETATFSSDAAMNFCLEKLQVDKLMARSPATVAASGWAQELAGLKRTSLLHVVTFPDSEANQRD